MKKIESLLEKVEYFERLAVYSDRSAFLKSLAQSVQTVPETVISSSPQFFSIPEDVQQMLSNITVVEGLIAVPLQIDGNVGPKTLAALRAFETKFNVPSNFSQSEIFDVIRNTYNRDSSYQEPGKDNSNKRPSLKPNNNIKTTNTEQIAIDPEFGG